MEREAAVKTIAATDTAKVEELIDLGYRIVAEKEVVGNASATPAQVAENTKPEHVEESTALTVTEIKEKLTAANVNYPASARKDMLISIAKNNGVVL